MALDDTDGVVRYECDVRGNPRKVSLADGRVWSRPAFVDTSFHP